MAPKDYVIRVFDDVAKIDPTQWNALLGEQASSTPFMRHEYLAAMQRSKSARAETGWVAQFLCVMASDEIVAACPLYIKDHSYGEYVFDWAWANAYEQHGLAYYPKAVVAVPFTPVPGTRLLARDAKSRTLLVQGLVALCKQEELSSLHLLFGADADIAACTEAGLMLRNTVQFHWTNAGYPDFDTFLASLSHDKRKKIRQERRKVADAGVSFRWSRGADIAKADWDFFYRCYTLTYRAHHSTPYLTREFFAQIHAAAPESVLLVIAEADGERLACALNMIGGDVMFGRYWGTKEFISGLHFETCYMQGIQYCIENRLARFEGGAQGVHKMSRGMLPTPTWSAHWVADPRFAHAISEFLDEETAAMDQHIQELEAHTPFRKKA